MANGNLLTLLSDKVSCPNCGGACPIIDVENLGMTFDGRAVAFEGERTACGASLIASRRTTTAEPTNVPGGLVGGGKSVRSQATQ